MEESLKGPARADALPMPKVLMRNLASVCALVYHAACANEKNIFPAGNVCVQDLERLAGWCKAALEYKEGLVAYRG